jgi:nucleoside-diphosphate-sugar epimerase
MRILILGGTGYMGPFVARQLAAQGHELTLFHRGHAHADLPAGIAHMHGDRAEIARFADEFRRLAPDVTLDMRPLVERDAQTALVALRGATGRVVAISSVDVYRAYGRLIGTEPGEPDPVPLTEESPTREHLYPYRGEVPRPADDPTRWRDDYDKIPIERLVLGDPALPGTILRLPMVHGPGDEQRRFFNFLHRMDDNRPAILLDRAMAGMLACREYVENVAAAIALAVTDGRAAGRIYNVCDAEPLTEEDWVRLVAREAGWAGEIVALPSEALPERLRAGGNTRQSLFASAARLRQELGYVPPIERQEGLRRTIAWERANPPATIDPALFDYAAEDAALAARF